MFCAFQFGSSKVLDRHSDTAGVKISTKHTHLNPKSRDLALLHVAFILMLLHILMSNLSDSQDVMPVFQKKISAACVEMELAASNNGGHK